MSSSMLGFTFFDIGGKKTEFKSKRLGKAIIRALELGCGELHCSDGTAIVIEKYGAYEKSIRALTVLSDEDIDDINSDSCTRKWFIKGLLTNGRISDVVYGNLGEHDRMAHFTLDSGTDHWMFDVSCGCRQFETTPVEDLLKLRPQNLRRVRA